MGIYRPKGSKNYHIKKVIKYGTRKVEIRESTGTSNKQLANRILNQRLSEEMDRLIYGVRYPFTFDDGAAQLIKNSSENRRKEAVQLLDGLMPFLAGVVLSDLHNEHPQVLAFKQAKVGLKNNTINRHLEVLRTILIRAGTLWIHEGKTWITQAPKIVLLPRLDEVGGYPLSHGQQRELFSRLPAHYWEVASVAINCGARKGELLGLRWRYERKVGNISVFALPTGTTKNGLSRLLYFNSEARRVIDQCRGKHGEFVFTYKGNPLRTIGKGWNKARKAAGLENIRGPSQHFRFHDLRHTCATRLRECGVGKEDRADILGHKSHDITTHYSSGEIMHLIECVERPLQMKERPTLYVASA